MDGRSKFGRNNINRNILIATRDNKVWRAMIAYVMNGHDI